MKNTRQIVAAAAVVAGAIGFVSQASAVTLTVTSITTNAMSNVDPLAQTVVSSNFFTAKSAIDSLVYLPNGNIVYTLESGQQIRQYNPSTHADSPITSVADAPKFSTDLQDLALEPTLTSVVVSDHNDPNNSSLGGGIYRVDIATGAISQLVTGRGYTGIIYNPADTTHFYAANLTNHTVSEFTTAGSLVKSITLPQVNGSNVGIDGLTFDSVTGALWGIEKFGSLVEIDTNLNAVTSFHTGDFQDMDGIASDGLGRLYMVERSNGLIGGAPRILNYVIATNTLTGSVGIPGLDDLAPASGLGAQTPNSPIPLPASVWSGLLLLGGMGLFAMVRGRRKLAFASTR